MASFRHRLQHKHNLNLPHLQASDIPPPPPSTAPWPAGSGSGSVSASATIASGVGTGTSSATFSPSPASPHYHPVSAHPLSAASRRPPLAQRGHSAAAVLTGQSRFVEGSMNDRVSAVPPPGFLGFDYVGEQNDDDDGGFDRCEGGVDRGSPGKRKVGAQYRDGGNGLEEWGVGIGTADWIRSSAAQVTGTSSAAAATSAQHETEQRSGVVKKASFLAPLWDGVREKLHLSKSKSSGSIGRVVNSVVGGGPERKVDREKEKERLMGREENVTSPVQPPPPSTAGYPSREEVLESYKNLMASGFFEAHAIRGGRHPPRTGGAAATNGAKSFADHMAATAQQQGPTLPFSSPPRASMAPPPPPRGSSRGKPATLSSPQRGTKRGASMDLAGDAEMVTRKLVKKLRHSASRLSIDLTGARSSQSYNNYGTLRPRPSTSSNPPGPLSPTSSVFSAFTSPPSIKEFTNDDAASIRHGKLTKPKDGRRRRILGLTRRRPFSEPSSSSVGAVEPDLDAMMIDEPEQQQQQQQQSAANREPEPEQRQPRPHRIFTPPPAAFRTTHHARGVRVVSNSDSSIMSLKEEDEPRMEQQREPGHKPLSVVPDPNQGIPMVPRIPREFCDAMAALAPPAPVVVVGAAAAGDGMKEKKEKEEQAKVVNRDSGLGDDMDVENIPVWGS
ncbi:hypothetical protein C7999DRAFT_10296 [Corynascus novoguineensis]|uniref:Uncharacterized protein n=1 Tax=Corynascus novoguineensis TaxID=1126955 RepID=A0AAN7D266_9PEZI|nr:hypothetical protein C7999DRAFT_10296 [Corynascus novoguineensis]